MRKSIFSIVAILIILSLALVACGGAATPAPEQPAAEQPAAEQPAAEQPAAGEAVKIGLSFSDFATERWKNEEVLMRGLLEDLGYEVLSQEANHDVKLQNDQIDNMVSQGVKGLIIIAEDGDAIVTAVDKAAEAGVQVLAYDRLIKSPKIAAYLSFNNIEVGRQQADGVMKAIDIENWDVAANGKLRLVKLGGSPTDNNAILFRQGQDEILAQYEDKFEIVADQWVDNWDPANALKLMENILTAAGNDVDAVVASNDGTALGALQAMKAQGLAGKVPISGQDATADGCNSIVKGELTVSILKDIRNLSPLAVDMMDKLVKGEAIEGLQNYTMAELTNDPSQAGEVPCVFLPVQQVNKDNVKELVVDSGFQSAEDVYRDVEAPAEGEAMGGPLKVCQVTDTGGIDDKSFNATAWKGVVEAQEELGAEGKYLESQQQTDYDKNLTQFIQEGCDLIVTVGFLLGDATAKYAEENPDIPFTIVDYAYDPTIPNVLGQVFNTDEAAFLAGYLAASQTESGVVGTWGGIAIPPVTIFMDGFLAGVNYHNQEKGTEVQVLGWNGTEGLFINNFESAEDGKKASASLADEGADIILPVAGPAGLGAAAVAQERDLMVIGVDSDWFDTAPEYQDYLLTSVLKNMNITVKEAAKMVQDGTFEGGVIVGTLENGGVGLAPLHNFEDQVSDDVKAELEALTGEVAAGNIKVSDYLTQ